jgi:hypothetical protein
MEITNFNIQNQFEKDRKKEYILQMFSKNYIV